MKIGNKDFSLERASATRVSGHTYVMGILNVTPDSFSDGGSYMQLDQALRQTERMVLEGADIIDVGGESTRPGYALLSPEEELARVIPVVEAVKRRFDIPLSLDTCKSQVAAEGIKAGADLINDIWGLKYDEDMPKVIAQGKKPCCLMHNRRDLDYSDLITDVINDLEESIELARQAGIPQKQIILDPGIGFGKTYGQNMEILGNLTKFTSLGYPVLLGASRKSVVGITLNLPTDQRLEGTLVTTVYAVLLGCAFVRVHDVKENVRAVRMAEAIRDAGK